VSKLPKQLETLRWRSPALYNLGLLTVNRLTGYPVPKGRSSYENISPVNLSSNFFGSPVNNASNVMAIGDISSLPRNHLLWRILYLTRFFPINCR